MSASDLLVQKYGGTSMGSPERIREVARRVQRFVKEGHQVVVVVSAMSGETNRLLGLAKELNPDAAIPEIDAAAPLRAELDSLRQEFGTTVGELKQLLETSKITGRSRSRNGNVPPAAQ